MEKIIYTRCSPWIDILGGGKINKSEGFGVAAVSPNFFSASQGISYKLLYRDLQDRKGDLNRYDKSYEYIQLGNGNAAFICEGELPLCKTARPNGGGHRPVFMAEGLIGKFQQNPAIYMNSVNFDGDSRSQNDYYRLDLGPETKPLELSPVDESALQRGNPPVPAGKEKLLAELIQYCYIELAKPAKERTVLFVRDTNENIISYVAAIAASLPSSLAKDFTFLTSTSSHQSNAERYAYYTLTQTGEVMEYNVYNEEARPLRQLRWLLVGYHVGQLNRNAKSQFHHVDATSGAATYQLAPGPFIRGLASGNPIAKACLDYINSSLGGVLPKDIDAFYSFYKVMLSPISTPVNNDDLASSISYYLNSGLSSSTLQAQVKQKAASLYPGMLEEDIRRGLPLYELVGRIDPSIAASCQGAIKQQMTALLAGVPNKKENASAYRSIRSLAAVKPLEGEVIGKTVTASYVSAIVKQGDPATIEFALELWETRQSLGLNHGLSQAESAALIEALTLLLVRYCDDKAALSRVDALLKNFPDRRGACYGQAILNAHKVGKDGSLETLVLQYNPALPPKDVTLYLAKAIKDFDFAYFEKKYASALSFTKKVNPSHTEILIDLFAVYPAAATSPKDGTIYGDAMLSLIKDPLDMNLLRNVLSYQRVLLEKKGKIAPAAKESLEKRLGAYVLQGGDLASLSSDLTALGIIMPARLSALKKNLLSNKGVRPQQEALAAFLKEGAYPITLNDLRLPYFQDLLKNLCFAKSMIHVVFWQAFPISDVRMMIETYSTMLLSYKETDKFLYYHSLCLILESPMDGANIKRYRQEIEKMLANPDNKYLEACYDKHYDRRLGELPENEPWIKKAKERLVKDFTKYGNAHKGFFAKLFGGKKKE